MAKLKAPVVNYIWNFKVPKKVKFFLWSLFYRSVNTIERLQKGYLIGFCPPPFAAFVIEVKKW